MPFRLIDSGWQTVMDDAATTHHTELRIICPFIKLRAVQRLLTHWNPTTLQVITRFNLRDFYDRVSDTAALRFLLNKGALIRGVRNLHAKLYLFDNARVVVTSANLTDAALTTNHEFGFDSDEPVILASCRSYFDRLWHNAGPNLTTACLTDWETRLMFILSGGTQPTLPAGLCDEGTEAGIAPMPIQIAVIANEASQWFIKFFGEDRATRTLPVLDEVRQHGSHWACTYPRQPRQVEDGAVIFLARLVNDPDDIIIFGRAVGIRYREDLDDATETDIARHPFKERFPYYVRVHHTQFVAGTMANGISLNALMNGLGSDAFASTQRNAASGHGNTDPRMAYRQQSAVELTPQAAAWVEEHLGTAFAQHGTLTPTDMRGLDWPEPPNLAPVGVTP